MEKNQEFIVTIEDMNEDGAGVGKVDGYIWFCLLYTSVKYQLDCKDKGGVAVLALGVYKFNLIKSVFAGGT